MRTRKSAERLGATAMAAVVLLGVPTLGGAVQQEDPAAGAVSFTRDVAPILQENCETCHRAGGMGPMSLATYDEVRPWAPLVKHQVESRVMPPWHIDRTVGIQEFANDVSLTDAEIGTIVRWADAGAPMGDPADMPPALEWPTEPGWELEGLMGRAPDYIIKTQPYTVMDSGNDQWWHPKHVMNLDGTRFIRGAETRPSPGSRPVTHHANSDISRFAVGKPYDLLPTDVGLRLDPGDEITFNIHYFPLGYAIEDAFVEVALWFWPEDNEPRLMAAGGSTTFSSLTDPVGPAAQEIVVPPHGTQVTVGYRVLQKPGMIYSVRGHQHILGVGQQIEAIYPDGRREILSRVGWAHGWHINYDYEEHVIPLLPAGTVVVTTAWYDNTDRPENPDPDQWLVFGRRSADEMSHMHIGFVEMEQEDYDRLVAERERGEDVAQASTGGR